MTAGANFQKRVRLTGKPPPQPVQPPANLQASPYDVGYERHFPVQRD